MKSELIAAIIALIILTTAVCSYSDPIVVPDDPVEVVRASENAWLSKGDWRIYLSKRWQDMITPAIMNGINFQRKISEERIQNQAKDKNGVQPSVNSSKPELKDIKLANATDNTAIVDYTLSVISSGKSQIVTFHDYLIKEDGHWARDVIGPNMRPEWAMPADLKPVYQAISEILQQEHSAYLDDQGKPRYDPGAVEAYAKKNLAAESLLYVGAKEFAENYEKAVMRSKYANRISTLISMVMDIEHTWTFEQTEYVGVSIGNIVCRTNDKDEIEAAIGGNSYLFVKEQGNWKRLLVVDSKQIASRFLQLWHDKDKDNLARMLAPDAKFDMGNGKSLSWDEFSKSLPVPDQVSDVKQSSDPHSATFQAILHFTTDDSAYKSGMYEIAVSSVNKGAFLTQHKIFSLRLVDDAVKPQVNNSQESSSLSPLPISEPVKPVPMINGEFIQPPVELPVELRSKGDRGGIYFDDILLTNDSKPIFFDDFQSGDLSGWSSIDDAKVESSSSKACCLYLNRQGPVVSEAFHNILVKNPGVVELSVWVWLPPASEQESSALTSLNLTSGTSADGIGVGIEEDGRGKGYVIKLNWNRSDGDNKEVQSQGSVLQSGKWARLTLRLDNGTGNASAILNGVTQASFHYTPYNFRAINMMSAWGNLGAAKKAAWHYGGSQSSVWLAGNHGAAAGTTKYEMIDLGALTHLSDTQAMAINNTGLVMFGNFYDGSISLFLWQNGKVRPFKNQGYSFGALNDLNQIAGVKVTDFNKPAGTAALWQNGKITPLGAIGKSGVWPSSINNKGQIAGITATAHGCRPAVWENGRVRVLETPEGANDSCAYDINASGQVVGRVTDVHNTGHAYMWQAGKGVDLGVLPTCTQSEGLSINDKGHVIGRSFGPDGWDTGKGDLRSFIWVNSVMRDLGSVLGGNRITACSINNNDDVVGYASRADGETRGFILKHGRVTDLGVLPKGTASYAIAINDHGWIIGYATTANSKNHAVLWRPVKKTK